MGEGAGGGGGEGGEVGVGGRRRGDKARVFIAHVTLSPCAESMSTEQGWQYKILQILDAHFKQILISAIFATRTSVSCI